MEPDLDRIKEMCYHLVSTEQISEDFKINPDGTVDVSDVTFNDPTLQKIPLCFNHVINFYCINTPAKKSNIDSLKNSPKEVCIFDCTDTAIYSLENCPKIIHESFNCKFTKIENPYDLRHVLFCEVGEYFTFYSDFNVNDIITNFLLKPKDQRKTEIFKVLEELKRA